MDHAVPPVNSRGGKCWVTLRTPGDNEGDEDEMSLSGSTAAFVFAFRGISALCKGELVDEESDASDGSKGSSQQLEIGGQTTFVLHADDTGINGKRTATAGTYTSGVQNQYATTCESKTIKKVPMRNPLARHARPAKAKAARVNKTKKLATATTSSRSPLSRATARKIALYVTASAALTARYTESIATVTTPATGLLVLLETTGHGTDSKLTLRISTGSPVGAIPNEGRNGGAGGWGGRHFLEKLALFLLPAGLEY
ncbi:hypothetical protein DIPPA_14076 [Diplonema papillatum]|nr:hypothetical protein DIPPA_14076 [Diplonema papillatum]